MILLTFIYTRSMKNEFLKYIKAKDDGTTLVEHTKAVIDRALDLLNAMSITADDYIILKNKIIIASVLHDLGKIHHGVGIRSSSSALGHHWL